MATTTGRTHRLGGCYARLSATNPAVFLLLYLLLIPLFAIAYWGLAQLHTAQDFYAPYARHEPAALADKREIEAQLRAALLRALDANARSSPAWSIDRRSMDVYALSAPTDGDLASAGAVTSTLFVRAARDTNLGRVMVSGPNEITLSTRRTMFDLSTNPIVCHAASTPSSSHLVQVDDLDFSLLLTPPPPYRLASSICWPQGAEDRFARLLAGWRGDPRTLSAFFGRMVYFSATTITTVGYGDIVPLSDAARTLTALESLLGWLLAGLFLNAVAWQAGSAAAKR
jgi:hypothetical protein